MNLALRITSYVMVLAVGLAGGYYIGFGSGQGRAMAFDMLESTYYSAYLDMQMSEGNDSAREGAIRTFLALSEQRRERNGPLFSETMYAADAALGNARLAALATKRGASQEAQQYLVRAESYCPLTGWAECSAATIVDAVHRLDKKGIFAAGASN